MKVRYTAPRGDIVLESEPENLKRSFEFYAKAVELFSPPDKCPYCQSTDIRPNFRDPQGNSYYAWRCVCGAERQFGQNKDGTGMWLKDWQPPYQGSGGSTQTTGQSGGQQGSGSAAPKQEEIPFSIGWLLLPFAALLSTVA